MGWRGYIGDELDRFLVDPRMQSYVETYALLGKHEGSTAARDYLFGQIQQLLRDWNKLKDDHAALKEYCTALEERLARR
jgi:hypothetical protein